MSCCRRQRYPAFRASRSLVLSFLTAALAVGPAAAKDRLQRFELFAQGGVSAFTRVGRLHIFIPPGSPDFVHYYRVENSFGASGRLFTGLRYYLTGNNALEASYSYSPNRFRLTFTVTSSLPDPLFPPQTWFDSTPMAVHNVAFNYVRYLPAHHRLHPFVTVGLGFAMFETHYEGQTRFAANWGAGVDIPLRQRICLRGEFRHFLTERPGFEGFTTITHNFAPSVGLAFKF